VLNNSEDIFDWADTIPGSYLSKIQLPGEEAVSAWSNMGGSTYYVFPDATKPPFNNQYAREAVVTGAEREHMEPPRRRTLAPACFFCRRRFLGIRAGSGPFGTPPATATPPRPKALVAKSGDANTPITVYSEERSPRLQWMTYYEQELKAIGFKNVTMKEVADAHYFTTLVSRSRLDPQTGFADWNQDFPNPVRLLRSPARRSFGHADEQRELRPDE